MIDANKPFGEFIRGVRTSKGIPLRKLAFVLDIDQSTLAKMERGEKNFSIDMASSLAEALELDYKHVQIALLASVVLSEVGKEAYVKEGLKMAVKQLNKTK